LAADGSPVEFRMTFEEWLAVWLESGRYHLRRSGGWCMARYGDLGHYEVGNVRIASPAENTADYVPRCTQWVNGTWAPCREQKRQRRRPQRCDAASGGGHGSR
jgi:hypothetical protein